MKVETIVQKLPKDGGSLNRNDVKIIAKDQLIDLLNSQDEKVVNSKLFVELTAEIAQIRQEILSSSSRRGTKSPPLTQEQAAKMSFTAGQSLLGDSQTKRINKDTLKECLDDNEMNIINDIIDEAVEGSNGKVVVVVPDPMKEIN